MSICDQLVIAHGGMFGFELGPKGPKFGFLIPLDHMNSKLSTTTEDLVILDSSKKVASAAIAKPVAVPPTAAGAQGELFALVVDDVKTNRQLLGRVVGNRGFKVDMVEDGQKAVDYIKENCDKINVIFMDNMMPVMTGIESTAACRDLGYGGLVIGVTGNTLGEEVVAFLDAGADIILGKPVNTSQLDAIIDQIRTYGKFSPKLKVHDSRNDDALKEQFEKLNIEVKRLAK